MFATIRQTMALSLLGALLIPGCGGGGVLSPALDVETPETGLPSDPSEPPVMPDNVKSMKSPTLAEPINLRPVD